MLRSTPDSWPYLVPGSSDAALPFKGSSALLLCLVPGLILAMLMLWPQPPPLEHSLSLSNEHEQSYLPLATACAALAKLGMEACTFAYYLAALRGALYLLFISREPSSSSILYRQRAELNPDSSPACHYPLSTLIVRPASHKSYLCSGAPLSFIP